MMTRNAKALFYSLASPAMRISAACYRQFRAPGSGNTQLIKVHLGPGQKNYLPGWINVDANTFTGKCDVWANLAQGLPFRDASVDAVYSHHVIEHLPDLQGHFAEMFRILKPGGVFRVGGPNGDAALREYLAGNRGWFPDFPDARKSLGGRLENFLFCRGEHLTILTPSYLFEIAEGIGFAELQTALPVTGTFHPDFFDEAVRATEWENTPESPHTLLIEGRKPRA
jgi:SAM-dependent methyltransferase